MLTNQKSVLIWLNTLFGNHQTGTMPSCLPKVTWGLFFSFFWGLFACFARLLLLSRLDLWTRCVAAFRQSVLRLAAALSSLSRHVLSCVWRRRRGGGEWRRNTEPDGNHTPPPIPLNASSLTLSLSAVSLPTGMCASAALRLLIYS